MISISLETGSPHGNMFLGILETFFALFLMYFRYVSTINKKTAQKQKKCRVTSWPKSM